MLVHSLAMKLNEKIAIDTLSHVKPQLVIFTVGFCTD